MHKSNFRDVYHVSLLFFSVKWLGEIQNASVSVHSEETNRNLISTWTSDTVIDLFNFIITGTDLGDKKQQQNCVITLSVIKAVVKISLHNFSYNKIVV